METTPQTPTIPTIDFRVNAKMFQPSIWDDFPMKRDNQRMNWIIQSDFELDLPQKIQLPKNFQFIELKLPEHTQRIAQFLNKFYCNKHTDDADDDTINSQITYSPEYIQHIYRSPKKQFKKLNHLSLDYFIIGIEEIASGEMYGFVSAVPMTYSIDGRVINGVIVDKLCTHTLARGKRMSVVLLKEIYRRLKNIEYESAAIFNTQSDLPFQAITVSSTIIEKVFAKQEQTQDAKNRIQELKMQRDDSSNVEDIKKINKDIMGLQTINVQPTKDIHQIRLANKRDIDGLMKIYYKYTQKFRFFRIYNKKEFEHEFLPKRDLIYTYVLTNSQGEVKDFVTINVFIDTRCQKIAYIRYISFFNEDLLKVFMKNILYILKESEFDKVISNEWYGVSNTLVESLGFEAKSQSSSWYAFNYNTKTISQQECGINTFL